MFKSQQLQNVVLLFSYSVCCFFLSFFLFLGGGGSFVCRGVCVCNCPTQSSHADPVGVYGAASGCLTDQDELQGLNVKELKVTLE